MTKYQLIFEELRQEIENGRYQAGDRLPSEAELTVRFGASRLTVARAIRELQLQGLAIRRAGSGTYACERSRGTTYVFGLLIPELGQTEIFEPVCRGMMDLNKAQGHSLLWGNSFSEYGQVQEQAFRLCRGYIEQKVAGVFFAPLEFVQNKDQVNQRIAADLERAGIPLILLDRCIEPYPRRSRFDLVGIDNRRAGFAITEHLLNDGCRRIAFLARPLSAPTVDARIAGYREALFLRDILPNADWVQRIDGADPAAVLAFFQQHRPDGFVCANDHTATILMRSLQTLGIDVPHQVRVAGIDDVKYASMLQVPLTTIHQPCREIGAAAMSAMLDRIEHPNMPPREILLDFSLVIRQSCGIKHGG